ncbi:MAG: hypothetical protein LBH79_05430 [Nitrososphaerota archaeon]|nr:hypothetical protein [Nitrososphaerota archaeon]
MFNKTTNKNIKLNTYKITIVAIVTAFLIGGIVGLYLGSNHFIQAPIATDKTDIQQPQPTQDTAQPIKQPENQPTQPDPTTEPPPETGLTFSFQVKDSEANPDGKTKLTLTISVSYTGSSSATIDYSDFHLNLYVERSFYCLRIDRGVTTPLNQGSFTLSNSHKTHTFELTFEYITMQDNNMDIVYTQFTVGYRDTVLPWNS